MKIDFSIKKFNEGILHNIGGTTLMDLSSLSETKSVKIFAKLEGENPTGSIKDRVARCLIFDSEKQGFLKQGQTIIEPTSGNTGIGLAMIAKIRGYKMIAVMPNSVSSERISLLKSFGSEIIFSDGKEGTNGSIKLAQKISKENPEYFMPFQYGNQASIKAHYYTTGEEIVKQKPNVTHFVAGLGTGGTLMGVGKRLKEHNPSIKIIATAPHPDDVVQGLRSIEHGYIPPILDLDKLDGRIMVEAQESFFWTKKVMETHGLFVGVSSGATLATCVKLSKRLENSTIVTIFADNGWKYLSSGIYEREFDEISKEIDGKVWW